MLYRLLERLAQGGVHTPAELANELGVSEDLLEQMLMDLARRGYLRPLALGEGCNPNPHPPGRGRCSGCGLATAEGCALGLRGRIWTLTEKGARLRSRSG